MIGVNAMLKKILSPLVLLLFLGIPRAAMPQLADTPWPMFHHDLRHTGKTASFGTNVGKLKWQFVTGGPVTSSPVLDNNGFLYIRSADNNFYAINAETGSLEWKYTTGGAIELASPALDEDDVIYIGSNDGYLYAFDIGAIDPLDPEPVWKFKTGGAISSSPAIDDNGNIIFSSNDGYIYAVSPSGTQQWRTYVGASWCSPAIDTDKNQVYVGSWKPQASTIYQFETTIDNETVILSTAVNYFALASSSGAINWEFPGYTIEFCVPGGVLASPVISPDGSIIAAYFISFDNDSPCEDDQWKYNVFNIDSDTGFALWRLNLESDADIYGTPAMLEDNSIFVPAGDNLHRILPDMTSYLAVQGDGERIESSPAIDGGKLIFVGSNGGRFYCLCADCPETPVIWQYPPEGQDPLQAVNVGGTVSVASIISSPAIGADERRSVYVGASDGNIYAFYDGPRIFGKIDLVSDDGATKTPLRAAKLTLTSQFVEGERVTYTDTNGNYVFAGVDNFSYTIVPEKIGYVFSPESRTVVISQDQDAANINFEAFSGFSISGSITAASGSGIANVSVTLDGRNTVPVTTTTDGSGTYSFSGLSFDTYTVTPFLEDYGFTPPFREVTIASGDTSKDKTNINFVATQGYQISGKVLDVTSGEALSNGIEGVAVALTGDAAATAQTDENGAYSFVGLENGSYVITPSYNAYNFEPSSQAITIASANVDNVNFVAATGSTISGYIEIDGADNATITSVSIDLFAGGTLSSFGNLLPEGASQAQEPISTVHPDSSGYFVFIGIGSGTYPIKPRLPHYGFSQLSRTVTVGGDDMRKLLSLGKAGCYIAGKVPHLLSLSGMADVTVDLAGGENEATATTAKDGVYSFTGLASGTYTVSIIQSGYEAWPESQTIELVGEAQEDINFSIRPICPIVYPNIPFIGGEGSLVNIFGINFGLTEPDNSTIYSIGDSSDPLGPQTQLAGGVYFGSSDPTTWVRAKVKFWSPVKILVEAPAGFGLVNLWVINDTQCYYAPAPLTNMFLLGVPLD